MEGTNEYLELIFQINYHDYKVIILDNNSMMITLYKLA